jgi:hypothetical protein
MTRRSLAVVPVVLLLVVGVPVDGHAQVFIASHPYPEFKIGPLFVSAAVSRQSIGGDPGPLIATVSWSLVLPADQSAATIAQDLYVLWPGEIEGSPGDAGADSGLVRQVRALGFTIRENGRLRLSARARSDMGTGAQSKQLAQAPFVTFIRDEGAARGARGVSFIRIPWASELASLDWLVRLEVPLKGAITAKTTSWLEEMFWGRRYVVTLGWGDVGSVSLYPLYFGARNRVVPLAQDFSMVLLNFSDSDHLKLDEVVPASANRRASESRRNTETVSVPLVASEGLVPQVLRVQFNYFPGRLAWRPILISALFLFLGNLTGPMFAALARRAARTFRARVHVGPGREQRERGAILSRETLERIRPGETSYDEVLRLCGPNAEEQRHLASNQTRTLIYRGERVVPHRSRSFGWFATISHWDVEHHETQIDFEGDRVRDIQARIRRSRLAQPSTG